MPSNDDYRNGSLWKHKCCDTVVRVCGVDGDTVLFKYDDANGHPFITSRPLFELFYEKIDSSEEGLIYLSKV